MPAELLNIDQRGLEVARSIVERVAQGGPEAQVLAAVQVAVVEAIKAAVGQPTPLGVAPLAHVESALGWFDDGLRRHRLHTGWCTWHDPSAQCSCGLHRALSDLRMARNALEGFR